MFTESKTKTSKREQSRTRCRPFGHLIYPLFIVRLMHFRRQRQWCPLPIVQSCCSKHMILCKWKIQGGVWVWKVKILRKGHRPSRWMLNGNFFFLLLIKGNKIKQEPGEMEMLREKEGPMSSLDSEVEQTLFQWVMADRQDGHPDTGTYWAIYECPCLQSEEVTPIFSVYRRNRAIGAEEMA